MSKTSKIATNRDNFHDIKSKMLDFDMKYNIKYANFEIKISARIQKNVNYLILSSWLVVFANFSSLIRFVFISLLISSKLFFNFQLLPLSQLDSMVQYALGITPQMSYFQNDFYFYRSRKIYQK